MDYKQVLKAFVRFCFEHQRACIKFEDALANIGISVSDNSHDLANEVLRGHDSPLSPFTRPEIFNSNEFGNDFFGCLGDVDFEEFWNKYYEREEY